HLRGRPLHADSPPGSVCQPFGRDARGESSTALVRSRARSTSSAIRPWRAPMALASLPMHRSVTMIDRAASMSSSCMARRFSPMVANRSGIWGSPLALGGDDFAAGADEPGLFGDVLPSVAPGMGCGPDGFHPVVQAVAAEALVRGV